MARRKVENFTPESAKLRISDRLQSLAIEPNILGYRHHMKQAKFHSCDYFSIQPAIDNEKIGVIANPFIKIREKNLVQKVRFYVGGNRSGKTVGGIIEDIWWVTKKHPYIDVGAIYPEPIRGRICTTDFVNGGEGIIIPALKRWCPASEFRGGSWEAAWDAEERTVHFVNDGFIELRSYDQQLDKHAGTSRHFVHFDEEPPEDIFNENMARLTDTGGRCWFTMTPVEGMTWTFDRLYEPGVKGESAFSTLIVEASLRDNPWIDPEEIAILEAIYDEDEANVRIGGSYVAKTGLIYPEFSRDIHVIRHHNFELPDLSNSVIIASLDHGHINPTAWLWHALMPTGRLLTFWEWYHAGFVVSEHAGKVLEINAKIGREPDYYVGDPSIRNTDPITRTSILEEYAKYGILINASPGLNERQAGIDRVKAFMRPIWTDGITGEKRSFWAVYERCEKLIWELGRYRWAEWAMKGSAREHNKKEEPRKKDDHACDSLRYCIMSQPNFGELVKDLVKVKAPLATTPVGASNVYAKPENQIDHDLRRKLNPNQIASDGWEYDQYPKEKTVWKEEMYGEW